MESRYGIGINNRYGDISFYNPLYPFFEFITENTPYKYVSARKGNGVWSDPHHWTQDLDPGFFVDDGNGNIVNGIPDGSEPGVYEGGPKLGTILGQDISGNATDPSPFLPPPGTPNFGSNLPESSVLLGPGSTGFVPQNTDGTPGLAFQNPAQYFDVHLVNRGRTKVDIDVEIDRLTIDGRKTRFYLPEGITFSSLIGVEHFRGRSHIDGLLNAGNVLLFGGTVGGDGVVATNAFFNIAGVLAPGGKDDIGTFTIDGDYIQSSEAALLVDVKRSRRKGVSYDQLIVTGNASLDGYLLIKPKKKKARFKAEWAVLSANSVLGDFDEVELLTRSPVLFADTRIEGGDVIVEIGARRISKLVKSRYRSLGHALDKLRFGGRYEKYESIFDVVDSADFSNFGRTLSALTPSSGFQQTFSATSFAQRFTGQVSQRTLELRGANRAAAGFSAAGEATFTQTGRSPNDLDRLGFFASASGSYLADARSHEQSGARAFEEAAFVEPGELTLGADYRVSDSVTLGFAMSSFRDGASGALTPDGNESTGGAAYAATTFGRGFSDFYVGFSEQRYGLVRGSDGNALDAFSAASGRSRGKQNFAGLRFGYAMELTRNIVVGPVTSVDVVRSELGGYREIGAGDFGLDVASRTVSSVGAKVGAMASMNLDIGETGRLTAFGSVAYAQELGDSRDVVTATFVGAPDVPFSIEREFDTQWIALNAGAEMALSDRVSARLTVTSDLDRGELSQNQANMTFSWRF